MRPARGIVVEVEVDHRRMTYAEFMRVLTDLNGRIVSREGFWPLSRYKVLIPKKNARALTRLLEEVQRSEGGARTGA